MNKIAFMFPGQGAQAVGMGQDFYEKVPAAKAVYEKASQITGLDIPAICFTENDKIHQTCYTQIAMLVTEVAMLRALEEYGISAQVAAGLSLGEYAAIVACGGIREEDAFRIVKKRGIYMQEAVPFGGAMAAVLGLAPQTLESVIEDIRKEKEGIVSVANYNCPGQIVITGEGTAVERAARACRLAGAKRVLPLKVSGPFHSVMMETAGQKLQEEFKDVVIQPLKIPYVANLTAEYVYNKDEVISLLIRQISGSVFWQQSVERMIADGVDTFIEIGPGKTLAGFVKKISKEVKVLNIEHYEDVKKCMEE